MLGVAPALARAAARAAAAVAGETGNGMVFVFLVLLLVVVMVVVVEVAAEAAAAVGMEAVVVVACDFFLVLLVVVVGRGAAVEGEEADAAMARFGAALREEVDMGAALAVALLVLLAVVVMGAGEAVGAVEDAVPRAFFPFVFVACGSSLATAAAPFFAAGTRATGTTTPSTISRLRHRDDGGALGKGKGRVAGSLAYAAGASLLLLAFISRAVLLEARLLGITARAAAADEEDEKRRTVGWRA